MSASEKPETRLTERAPQKPSQQRIIEATREFVSEGGALGELHRAARELIDLAQPAMYYPDRLEYLASMAGTREYVHGAPIPQERYRTVSHRPELNQGEIHQVLFAHNGITGEYGSGVGMIGSLFTPQDFRTESFNAETFERRLGIVAGVLQGKSQLTSIKHTGFAEKMQINQETPLAAISRCGDEIYHWVRVNSESGVITDQQAEIFGLALAKYTAAVEKVNAYAQQVFSYVGIPQNKRLGTAPTDTKLPE